MNTISLLKDGDSSTGCSVDEPEDTILSRISQSQRRILWFHFREVPGGVECIHTDRKQNGGRKGGRSGERGYSLVPVLQDEKELGSEWCWQLHNTVRVYLTLSELYTKMARMANFMLCAFCQNLFLIREKARCKPVSIKLVTHIKWREEVKTPVFYLHGYAFQSSEKMLRN